MTENEVRLDELRREYRLRALRKGQVDPSPFRQFALWFEEAVSAALPDPNAMVLASADSRGRPSARVVLLKSYDPHGFVFFTNYLSRKAKTLEENPQAALLFYWSALERQVRIEGGTEKVPEDESDQYFETRPLGSQISAWASPQSEVIENRAALEERFQQFLERFPEGPVPRPPFWGGYRLIPDCFEFWQGRAERLHDRIQYRLTADNGWSLDRLSP